MYVHVTYNEKEKKIILQGVEENTYDIVQVHVHILTPPNHFSLMLAYYESISHLKYGYHICL